MKTATNLFLLAALLVATVGQPIDALGEPAVRMSYLQNDIHHLPLWVAMEKGYFKQEGVNVEIAAIFKAGPETMAAFAGGSLDVGYVGEAPATTAVANKTARVKAVAQVNTEGSAIVVAADSRMKSPKDLKGKTVAVPGHSTVQDFLLRKALKQNRLGLDQVNIIVLKPPEMIGALRTKQIDAFIAWEPYPSKALTSGVGRLLATSRDIWKNHPCCVIAVDTAFLEKNRAKVRSIARAHVRAIEFIKKNPEEAAKIAVKYTGMDEKTVKAAMKNVAYTPQLSVEGEREYVDFLNKMKFIKVDNPDAFVKRFLKSEVGDDTAVK